MEQIDFLPGHQMRMTDLFKRIENVSTIDKLTYL